MVLTIIEFSYKFIFTIIILLKIDDIDVIIIARVGERVGQGS
jgi:hypothetical protein